MGEVIRVALSRGYCDTILSELIQAYRQRCQLLCGILQSEPGIRLLPHNIPRGGYFVWISSFDGIDDTSSFLEYCQPRGLSFLPGIRCAVTSTPNSDNNSVNHEQYASCRRAVRLCFADMDVADIQAGSQLLIQCYRDFIGGRKE